MNLAEKQLRDDFRQILTDEFQRLQAKNPRFSIRAFAKKLGTNHTVIGRILDGTRTVTFKTFVSMAVTAGISSSKFAHAIERYNKQTKANPLPRFASPEQFIALSSVQASVIATVIGALKPKLDYDELSKISKVPKDKVKVIVKAAMEAGIASVDSDGRLHWRGGNVWAPTEKDDNVVAMRDRNISEMFALAKDYDKNHGWNDPFPKRAFHCAFSFSHSKRPFDKNLASEIFNEQTKNLERILSKKPKSKKGQPNKRASFVYLVAIIPTWEED